MTWHTKLCQVVTLSFEYKKSFSKQISILLLNNENPFKLKIESFWLKKGCDTRLIL